MGKTMKHVSLENGIEKLMIPGSKVAIVQEGNSLEHALLVLTKSGYSAIPVLDRDYKLKGLISMPLILDKVLGIEGIEYDKLSEMKVEDVMNKKIGWMREDGGFFRGLELSINHPFLCIVDEAGVFVGILTRKSILAQVNNYLKFNNT
ncbi:cyclic-di-AMP-binding protein CbpB [Aneurinibacillus migulanus]|jgi:predicted transcriptional regulator|nr:cyclic-di-AMP-binding protein CbpB [Aneurinibacillus migulanus]MED1614771.1 CBS domain-containing protein [Aneurinibacillus migulanus]GED14701.1 CBS domain-containing protein [Aneurinibacillus migulanus]CEH29372.1 CBS domain protein [Aneurinibacillus migulanus]